MKVFSDSFGSRIYGLDFTNCDSISIKTLEHIFKFKGLVILRIYDSIIDDHELEKLADVVTLKHLDLRHLRITDKALGYIGKLKNLECLTLCSEKITDKGLKEFSNLEKLKTLSLELCKKITGRGFENLYN